MNLRKFVFVPIALVTSACGVISLFIGSPQLPSSTDLYPDSASTPTHAFIQHWAKVKISKATQPPELPVVATQPSEAPQEQQELPITMMAEIVVETPIPEPPDSQFSSEEGATGTTNPEVNSPGSGGYKSIHVDISEQHLYAYEGDQLLYSFVASTGMNNATATGDFSVLSKIPNAYGDTWNIWMPNWLGIYWAGGLQNGIHALPILPNGAQLWEGYLGVPISYGCVVLGAYESKLLYDWAEIGTPVIIQW
jgi:lipoprotein-anchoring transpeptidase ErfK/SrfK